jgi:DNA-directed RNA polymerase subunit beta
MNQISFAKLETGMEMPHLLDIQTRAFESLLQLDAAQQDREDVGLERVFKDLFPITDVHENFSLEFVATASASRSTPSRSASSAT